MITLWGRNNSTNVKKVLWTLEELELPYDQILAGGKFGVNQDADYLAMNPNGLVPLLKDDETDRYCGNPMPLSAIWRRNTARTGYGLIIRRGVRRAKNGWTGRIKR